MVKTGWSRIFQKNNQFGEEAQNSSKTVFFFFLTFTRNLIHSCSFFTPKMVHNSVLYDSAKTACL